MRGKKFEYLDVFYVMEISFETIVSRLFLAGEISPFTRWRIRWWGFYSDREPHRNWSPQMVVNSKGISPESPKNKQVKELIGGGFKYFYVHTYLGKIPILTNIFQPGVSTTN